MRTRSAVTGPRRITLRLSVCATLTHVWSGYLYTMHCRCYSGGGYCSEAHAFAQSLSPFLGSRLGLVQHGDSINMRFINGLDAATRVQLQGMLLQPPRAYDADPAFSGVAICHSEPGAWHPANYQTSRCPPPQGQSHEWMLS